RRHVASWCSSLRPRRRRQMRPSTPPLPHCPADTADPDQERHERNVGELQPAIEAVDILAQSALNLAQLAPGCQHVAAELFDGLAIALADDDIAALSSVLELGKLVLHLFELGGERLLLLTIAPLRVPAQIVDKLERAVFGAATAQRDEGIRARQIV